MKISCARNIKFWDLKKKRINLTSCSKLIKLHKNEAKEIFGWQSHIIRILKHLDETSTSYYCILCTTFLSLSIHMSYVCANKLWKFDLFSSNLLTVIICYKNNSNGATPWLHIAATQEIMFSPTKPPKITFENIYEEIINFSIFIFFFVGGGGTNMMHLFSNGKYDNCL